MIRHAVRSTVDLLGQPVDRFLAPSDGTGVVTLIYHRVGRRSQSPVDLDTGVFERQLDLLAASQQVVSLDEGIDRVTGRANGSTTGNGAGSPAVVLTFDDGTADWPDIAMPALAERGLPAAFYVSTDFVERQRHFPDDGAPVSWAGLADMVATGLATICSHTHTHRVMHDLSERQARDEVDRSIELIEDRLGVTPQHFAYPKAVAPSPAAEVVVRRRFASATLAGNRAALRRADVHRLGRHALTMADDEESFVRKVAGGMVLEGWLREQRDAWQVRRPAHS